MVRHTVTVSMILRRSWRDQGPWLNRELARQLSRDPRRPAHHAGVPASPPPLSDEVVTPDVVGMVADEARRVAQAAGVVLAQPGLDGPPLSGPTWRLPVTVTAQDPSPGTVLRRWESAMAWWSSEEGGVREPRRPLPGALRGANRPGDAN